MAADSDTGSGAEMMSSEILALMEGDYPKAAWHALQLIQRYNDKQGLRDYMALLHILGYHKEAWALFNHQEVRSLNYALWQGAFIGHRREGKSAEEIQKWLQTDPIPRADFSAAGKFMLRTFLMDRPLDPQLAGFIRNIKWFNSGMGPQFLQVEKARYADFAEGYYAARTKNYAQAYDLYKKVFHFNGDSDLYDCSLPYAFISAAKLGRLPELEQELKRYPRGNDLFAAHLSKACVYVLQGKHSEAVSSLKFASYRIPPTLSLPFPARYQLVEICEFLHAETGNQEYLKLGLEWAKLQQRADPIHAWPYAVEAKYAESPADRLRALGLALYLDRHSAHIAHFSREERDKALKWLEPNNPFILSLKEKMNKAL